MMEKRVLVMDVECFKNYFLIGFKSVDSRVYRSFEIFEGRELDSASVLSIMQKFTIVTFNGMTYDMPMCAAAVHGWSCATLKSLSDNIITRELKAWQVENEYEISPLPGVDHIDLKEPVPGVMISLKLYGARLHSKRLQDMPVEHDALITPDQRSMVMSYNENDLDTTIDLWNTATDPKDNIIHTRELLTAEFGVDMRSKSDAQCAEAMIKVSVEKAKGERVYKQEVAPGTTYRYTPPSWVRFHHGTLTQVLADVRASHFVVQESGQIELPALIDREIAFGHSKYKMGIGGLHSSEKSQAIVGSADVLIRDFDVVSYYPSMILQCGLFPRNMGMDFQKVYKDFFERRMHAKKTGQKSVAQTLKIVMNGSFGKLGSKYSVLYSPDLLIQTTITGQLAILMLIERMEANGIPVVSANTDGIVMACPAYLEHEMLSIVKGWEGETGLETEETKYRALYSRDVNNYMALKVGGGYKVKGTLSLSGTMKNPDNDVVNMAVAALLDKGVPLAQTILGCRDIRRFLRAKRVTGGAKWGNQYLGRVVRWYRAVGSSTHIEYVTNGNKVGGSDCSQPLMDLPDQFPTDIDYNWYLSEANDLLRDMGALPKLAVVKKVRAPRGSKALARAGDPDTSADAAASFDTAAMEAAVLKVIAGFHDGCIADDIEACMPGCRWNTITPRLAPLIKKGLIEDTGRRKEAKSGRKQRVVAVTEKAKEYL